MQRFWITLNALARRSRRAGVALSGIQAYPKVSFRSVIYVAAPDTRWRQLSSLSWDRNFECQLHRPGALVSCWNCSKLGVDVTKSGGLFCAECGAVQPPCSGCDIFSVFQCPRGFSINETTLSQRYKQLQMRLHPDKTNLIAGQRQFSASQSAHVNDAYHTLKSPYLRAVYLLKSMGVDLESEDQSRNRHSDPQLLLEVMEIREEIETSDIVALRRILSATNRRMEGDIGGLTVAFAHGNVEQAIRLAVALKYHSKIREEAQNRMERLESEQFVRTSTAGTA